MKSLRWRAALHILEPPASAQPAVRESAFAQNARRTAWGTVAIAIINFVHIVVLWLSVSPTTPAETNWRLGLVIAHASMLTVSTCFGLWARRLLKRGPDAPTAHLLGPGIIAAILLASLAVVVVDQLLLPTITPFLIGAPLAGTLVLVAPRLSIPIFAVAFIVFALAIGLTQEDPNQLLSNRVNGVTVTILATLLSVLNWRRHVDAVQLQLAIAQSHAELTETKDRFAHLAAHDPLTGLFNRMEFIRLADMELARAHRHRRPTSLIAFDLDHFKSINDAHGHPGGDAALVHLANVLRTTLRTFDLIGRMGGEEFVVLLAETTAADARVVAERLRAAIEGAPVTLPDGGTAVLTASFGVACEVGAGTFTRLYTAADKALYVAKEGGRNRVATAEVWT